MAIINNPNCPYSEDPVYFETICWVINNSSHDILGQIARWMDGWMDRKTYKIIYLFTEHWSALPALFRHTVKILIANLIKYFSKPNQKNTHNQKNLKSKELLRYSRNTVFLSVVHLQMKYQFCSQKVLVKAWLHGLAWAEADQLSPHLLFTSY